MFELIGTFRRWLMSTDFLFIYLYHAVWGYRITLTDVYSTKGGYTDKGHNNGDLKHLQYPQTIQDSGVVSPVRWALLCPIVCWLYTVSLRLVLSQTMTSVQSSLVHLILPLSLSPSLSLSLSVFLSCRSKHPIHQTDNSNLRFLDSFVHTLHLKRS